MVLSLPANIFELAFRTEELGQFEIVCLQVDEFGAGFAWGRQLRRLIVEPPEGVRRCRLHQTAYNYFYFHYAGAHKQTPTPCP